MQRRLYSAFLLGAVMLLSRNATAASVSTLYSIHGSGDGAIPQSDLVVVGNIAYGTTNAGGKMGTGSIFGLNLMTGKVTTLCSFPAGESGSGPAAGLVQVGNNLYGTTGSLFQPTGTVFRFNPTNNALKTIYSGPPTVGDLVAYRGLLYGVQPGVNTPSQVVSFNPITGAEKVIYTFGSSNGGFSFSNGLTIAGSTLYGTLLGGGTNNAGIIYKIDIPSGAESVIWNFGATSTDGMEPAGHIAISGSMLYGTTLAGGVNGVGTVFGIDLATGAENVIYSFRGAKDGTSPQYGVVALNGVLYGVSNAVAESGPKIGEQIGFGTVFEVKPTTGQEITLHSFTLSSDGGYPEAGLTVINGLLYGSAEFGGTFGSGVVFSINPATRAFTNVYDFSGVDGDLTPGLTTVGDTLYGVATDGGPSGGNVFQIFASTGKTRNVFNFTGSTTGASPDSPLLNVGGTLYGTTAYGGPNGAGTVFAIDAAKGTETVVYAFQGGTDGELPGRLVTMGGTLYGIAALVDNGNAVDTVFAIDPATGSKTNIYVFDHNNDGDPNSLIPFKNYLFGTTAYGGAGYGSIFRLDTATKALKVMHKFQFGSDGCWPFAGLATYNGSLVGTTYYGGANYQGTVYSFNPVSGAVTTLYSFGINPQDGAYPWAALLPVGNMLYGTTYSGGSAQGGTVFQLDPATGVETILYNFNNTAANYPATAGGYAPAAPLSFINGVFYGTTSSGGTGNAGAVFSLTP